MSDSKQELPPGWAFAPLCDFARPSSEKVEPSACPDLPYVGLEHIESGTGRLLGHGYARDVRSTKAVFRRGDVLYGKLRPYLRKVWRAEFDGVCSTDILVYRPSAAIDGGYLRYVLASGSVTEHATRASAGISLPRVNASALGDVSVPLPPVGEQRRIVAKLDELLASSRSVLEALGTVPTRQPEYVRSLLAAAFRGHLTADVRAETNEDAGTELAAASLTRGTAWSTLLSDKVHLRRRNSSVRGGRTVEPPPPDLSHGVPDLPLGWKIASVGQLALCLDSFRVPVKRENRGAVGSYPYFGANGRVGEIDDYIFDLGLVLVTEDETFYGRTKPIAYRVSGRCWVNNHAHVLLPLAPYTPEFLHYALMYYDVEPWLTGTTGRAKLTQADLLRLPILVPPAKEREELCRRVRLGLETSDRMHERTVDLSAQAGVLEEACIGKAFRGELVPQDPADEPASALLERIRVERSDAPEPRSRRRTTARV